MPWPVINIAVRWPSEQELQFAIDLCGDGQLAAAGRLQKSFDHRGCFVGARGRIAAVSLRMSAKQGHDIRLASERHFGQHGMYERAQAPRVDKLVLVEKLLGI